MMGLGGDVHYFLGRSYGGKIDHAFLAMAGVRLPWRGYAVCGARVLIQAAPFSAAKTPCKRCVRRVP